MKRVWTSAVALPDGAHFTVALDARPIRTPAGNALLLPEAAAQAVAEEWQAAGGGAKGGEYDPHHLPLTRVAATAIDRIAPDPHAAAQGIAKYAETELLCYRADHPPALAARQASLWQPHLDWAALAFDAPLLVTQGIMPLAQDFRALAALRRVVARHDALTLAGLGLAVGALGSLVLGLALLHGRLDAAAATEASLLDETFQATLWGEDEEAAASRARVAADVALAARWLGLVRQSADA
jgi:chaperone required for assembly of F1-ATPase